MDDAAAIRATSTPWSNAGLDRNWDAMLSLCTDDVVFAPPGEPSVPAGKLKAWLEGFPVMKQFSFTFDRIDVSGNLATGVGRGTWTLNLNGRDVSATFKFADVFRRGSDGKWRYAHVIWNLDAPGS
jgi:ketosteroid isomerase-like protein